MKKKLIAFCILLTQNVIAQVGVVSHYHFNYLALNPALAGENGPFVVKGIVGNQFNGNLRFNQLSHGVVVDGQLYNKTGIAFQSLSENYGYGSGNNLSLSFAKGAEVGDLKIKGGLLGAVSLLPRYTGIGNNGSNANFNFGAGVLASYNQLFLGVSKPAIKKDNLSGESPWYFNGGVFSDNEDGVSWNANVLVAALNEKYNYDFNLKIWLDKRLALAGSYRINNIFSMYSKKNYFLPSVEFLVNEDLTLGLAYNNNSIRLSNAPVYDNTGFNMNGIFQFYVKYNQGNRKGEAWYKDRF